MIINLEDNVRKNYSETVSKINKGGDHGGKSRKDHVTNNQSCGSGFGKREDKTRRRDKTRNDAIRQIKTRHNKDKHKTKAHHKATVMTSVVANADAS
jgi:hypothetical protein